MKTPIKILLLLTIFSVPPVVYAGQGESIVFEPATGNYLITHYSDIDQKFEKLVYIPATKINPIFSSKLKLDENEIINYRYTLASGQDSQQVIRFFILDPVSSVKTPLPDIPLNARPGQIAVDMLNAAEYFIAPAHWDSLMGYSKGQMAFRVSWGYVHETGGLSPGSKADFGFRSRDLPGFISSEIYGFASGSQEIDGEEIPDTLEETRGDPFWKQYFSLMHNNFVPRPAAAPTIAVPDPFDAAVTLERIQAHMHTWIGMQLLDPAFSAQLDRYFQSAISAYRLNQPKVGKKHIQTMRALLKKEQPGADKEEADNEDDSHDKNRRTQIDKLAARILDFDLKYVAKRMAGDKDD